MHRTDYYRFPTRPTPFNTMEAIPEVTPLS